jgi:hypothetical protein
MVTIEIFLKSEDNIDIGLYDLNGRLIYSMAPENLSSGYHAKKLQLSGLNINSGIYFVKLRSTNNSITKKLIYQ